MKYIDADKLIEKFEKMIDNIPASVDSGAGYVIDEVYKIIDSLQQEQPQSNELYGAAEDSWAVYEYRESPRGLYSTCYVDGFKAGAEWMAGKFQKIEGELVDWYETNGVDYCHGISTNESFEVPEGFYIRKK